MELIPEMERLIHLIARAFAKTHGSENPDIYADTVVAHARTLADIPAEDSTEKTTEELAAPQAAPVPELGALNTVQNEDGTAETSYAPAQTEAAAEPSSTEQPAQ